MSSMSSFLEHSVETRVSEAPGAQPRFQSWGVQFLGLGYYTEQNTDGIPSFVHCSVSRNGNHTLHQESWGGPSKFFGVRTPLPQLPSGCARLRHDELERWRTTLDKSKKIDVLV